MININNCTFHFTLSLLTLAYLWLLFAAHGCVTSASGVLKIRCTSYSGKVEVQLFVSYSYFLFCFASNISCISVGAESSNATPKFVSLCFLNCSAKYFLTFVLEIAALRIRVGWVHFIYDWRAKDCCFFIGLDSPLHLVNKTVDFLIKIFVLNLTIKRRNCGVYTQNPISKIAAVHCYCYL